jgi:hypothetical protein
MSPAIRRLLSAWCLLALVMFVVTPPSMWHHHDAADHQHAEGGSTIEDVCPVCDNALPIVDHERVIGFSFVGVVMGMEFTGPLPTADVGHALVLADRGPPARTC